MSFKKIVLCFSMLLLGACSSNQAAAPKESVHSSPIASATAATETPTPELTPNSFVMLTCYDWADQEVQVDAADIEVLRNAWENPDALDCSSSPDEVTATTSLELAAQVAAAPAYKDYADGDISGFYELYLSMDNFYAGLDLSAKQSAEIRGMLILCPTHPLAKKFRKAIARGARSAAAAANGTQFPDGIHRVNDEIKPGTYVVTDVEACYWERQDKNGNIIDNYVTSSALRVQVSIQASDYSF